MPLITPGRILLHVMLPLVAGAAIYILFREGTWIHRFLGIKNAIFHPEQPGRLGNFIIYSGPDFLWAYSFTSAMLLWQSKPLRINIFFAGLILLLILLSEGVQILFQSCFRFDLWDLAAAFLGFLLSFFLINYPWQKRKSSSFS